MNLKVARRTSSSLAKKIEIQMRINLLDLIRIKQAAAGRRVVPYRMLQKINRSFQIRLAWSSQLRISWTRQALSTWRRSHTSTMARSRASSGRTISRSSQERKKTSSMWPRRTSVSTKQWISWVIKRHPPLSISSETASGKIKWRSTHSCLRTCQTWIWMI